MRTTMALIEQVHSARFVGGPLSFATDVVTFVSRPMWELVLAEVDKATDGMPDDSNADTLLVYGSETVVFESDAVWAYSVPRALLAQREDAA